MPLLQYWAGDVAAGMLTAAPVSSFGHPASVSAASNGAGEEQLMTDKNPQNMNVPDRPEPTHTDQRINPVPNERERAEREANKLAHKAIEREHEVDDMEKPFTK